MFIFGVIVGAAIVSGVWYGWAKYGAAVVKAADDFSSGIK